MIVTTDICAIYDLSFWAHFELVTIHPWADGNGRTCRLLMNLLQMEYDVLPSKVLRQDKAEYIQALIDAREAEDINIFLDCMAKLHIEHLKHDIRMYEESMRTPLIMRLPNGFVHNAATTEMVQNIDYAPTFLELAGAPVPDDIQGVSLLPLLKGEHPKDWRKALYYHFYEYPAEHMVKRHYGIRTERYKLIHFYDDIDQWELYDLQTDPTEMNNLFDKPGYESIIEKLKQELVGLQTLYGDSIEYRLRDKKL